MSTYKIVRYFAGAFPRETVMTGLSLEEAQGHCQDPETSSRTATEADAVALTERVGAWFDGYTEE